LAALEAAAATAIAATVELSNEETVDHSDAIPIPPLEEAPEFYPVRKPYDEHQYEAPDPEDDAYGGGQT